MSTHMTSVAKPHTSLSLAGSSVGVQGDEPAEGKMAPVARAETGANGPDSATAENDDPIDRWQTREELLSDPNLPDRAPDGTSSDVDGSCGRANLYTGKPVLGTSAGEEDFTAFFEHYTMLEAESNKKCDIIIRLCDLLGGSGLDSDQIEGSCEDGLSMIGTLPFRPAESIPSVEPAQGRSGVGSPDKDNFLRLSRRLEKAKTDFGTLIERVKDCNIADTSGTPAIGWSRDGNTALVQEIESGFQEYIRVLGETKRELKAVKRPNRQTARSLAAEMIARRTDPESEQRRVLVQMLGATPDSTWEDSD